jgi:hypothetical protein
MVNITTTLGANIAGGSDLGVLQQLKAAWLTSTM